MKIGQLLAIVLICGVGGIAGWGILQSRPPNPKQEQGEEKKGDGDEDKETGFGKVGLAKEMVFSRLTNRPPNDAICPKRYSRSSFTSSTSRHTLLAIRHEFGVLESSISSRMVLKNPRTPNFAVGAENKTA